jgi:ribokinase
MITLGQRGAMFVQGDAPAEFVSAEQVEAVDSTGAGDAFVGSFAYLIGQKRSLRDAVEKACAIATLSVMKAGTQTSFPTRDEVAHLLSDL